MPTGASPNDAANAGSSKGFILAINGGSSSLKFAILAAGEPASRAASGGVERVGRGGSRWVVKDHGNARSEVAAVEAPDQAAAAGLVVDWVDRAIGRGAIAAVGHRIVHGGSRFVEAAVVSASMLDELRKLSPLAPDHLPGEIALIEAFGKAFPDVPQVACFDTAFHRDMPAVATIVPIPRRYAARGVRRYGFHGLSYGYLMEELARVAGPEKARGRVVLAHLGSGASLAAVRDGRCLDTSMGFTPTSGLVMGTRSGDLDPALAGFLAAVEGMTAAQFQHLVNHESGLLGVSETSADLRDLMARRDGDSRAAEAVALFCYQIRKWIGAFAAVVGGLETLVFAGGIGENSPEVRRTVCEGLEFLGVCLDRDRNDAGAPRISADSSATDVRVIRTDEEAMIAREVARIVGRLGGAPEGRAPDAAGDKIETRGERV